VGEGLPDVALELGDGGSEEGSLRTLAGRLSALSVNRRWEPFEDLDWDREDFVIRPDDPDLMLPSWDPLASSTWYLDQDDAARSGIGLRRIVQLLDTGIRLEGALTQGLLSYISDLPDADAVRRYSRHEIIEEMKHSLLFDEFITRSGMVPARTSEDDDRFRRLAGLGRDFPMLFFLCVLAGESIMDHLQRRHLMDGRMHPLVRVVHQVHCREEARHVSFAQACLSDLTRRASTTELRRLKYLAPPLVAWTSARLVGVPDVGSSSLGLPDEVREATESSSQMAHLRRESAALVVATCRRLGIIDDRVGRLWAGAGLL
jgi:hypothetical protein